MFFFFPYQVDVPMQRLPLANLFLIAATAVISVLAMMAPDGMLHNWVLWRDEHFRAYQLLTNLFVHGGILHLLGNLIFLFTFGNAINAKLGHWQFLSLYLGIGLVESLLWYMTGPGQASLGASGAIMGVVGMFLVLYPPNDVTCFWMFFLRIGTFSISSYWLILLYILFDVWGLASDQGGTNYVAHVGGMVMGVGVITGLVMAGLIRSEPTEENLLEIMGWVKKKAPVPSGEWRTTRS